jgi:Fic family protein
MDPRNFEHSTTGQVVRTQNGYWAFIPARLPKYLEFTPRLIQALSQADRAAGELKGAGGALSNPSLLANPLLRQEAVLSSRIEGTRASLEDLYAFEAMQLPMFESFDDVREVHNYVRALEYGPQRLNTLPISLRLIREIHQVLMQGVRGNLWTPGEFRRSQNWIGPAGSTLESAPFVPPPVDEMQQALSDLEKYLHEPCDLPPLVRIGMFHYQFEAIHPFLDGNGRIGRLMIILLLCAWEILPQPLLYLSPYFEARRQEYYAGLLEVSRTGEWENWLLFFLDGVAIQSTKTLEKIRRLQELQEKLRTRVQGERAAIRLQQVVDTLFSQPVLSIRQLETALEVNYPTAQRYIERLVGLGMLQEVTGQARNRLYRCEQIFEIIRS